MSIREIEPAALAAAMEAGTHWQIVDVREAQELARARLDVALHIPMAELASRLDDIERDVPVAILCHSGQRSAHVTAFLTRAGFENIHNIRGGIDRWSTDVDGDIPRY